MISSDLHHGYLVGQSRELVVGDVSVGVGGYTHIKAEWLRHIKPFN